MGQELSRHGTPELGTSADLEKLLPLEVSNEKVSALPSEKETIASASLEDKSTSKKLFILAKVLARKSKSRKSKSKIRSEPAPEPEVPTRTQPVQTSLLLALPTELQHQIYAFAVVQEDPVIISSSGDIPIPPLLQTCHLIRQLTTPIFYSQNTFTYHSSHYSHPPLLRLNSQYAELISMHNIVIKLNVSLQDDPSWPNVLLWLEKLHKGEMMMVACNTKPDKHVLNGGSQEKHLLWLTFKVVVAMRTIAWEKVTEVLEDLHSALVRLDEVWM